jgi:hypothetical protein
VTFGRRWGALPTLGAGAALLFLGLLPSGVRGQDAVFEEGFFEVFVQRIPNRITVSTLVDARGAVLIPLRPIVDLVGIPVQSDGDALILEWPPGAWRTVIRRDQRLVSVGGEEEVVPAAEFVVRVDGLFVSSRVLARVLAARVDLDWAGLAVVISENPEFPATRRLEREARRERERLAAERLRPDRRDLAFAPHSGGGAGTWGVSLTGAEGSYRGSLRTAVGGSVLGGATEMGGTVSFGDNVQESFGESYLRFHRVFPNGTLVRQVEVGSVLSRGPVARRILGFGLTNEPYTTPRYFADALIQPAVPAGWEFEVYQGDALVGVSSRDDPESLRAPLNYGNTPVRVRMIGPAGQERVEELLYVVPPDRLPAGAWRYNLGLGPCQDPGCDSYGYAELRRGFTSWLTAGVGVDRIDPAEGDAEARGFGYLGFSPTQNVSMELQAQPGAFLQAGLDVATAGSGAYGASYAWTRPAGDAPTMDGWYSQFSANVPLNVFGGRTVAGRVQLRGNQRGTIDSWQLFSATTVRRSYVSAEFEAGLQVNKVLTARVFTPLGSDWHRYLADLAVSTGVGATSRGPEILEVGASFRPAATGSVSVDLRFRRGSSPLLSVGFVARRPQGYFQARAASGSGSGLFLAADGGVAFDRETGLVPLPFQSLGRAGIRGRVFRDLDGDGIQGDGEPGEPGVDVLVQGDRVTTDAQGDYSTWEVRPYEAATVAVDSLSIDYSWVPAPRQALLRPSPNMFNEVNLPLLQTREVAGRVLLDGAEPQPLGGVLVEIVDGEGNVLARQRTFSDGVYYVQRVPPGEYTVRVAPSSATALGLTEPPSARLLVRGGAADDVEVPPLLVPPSRN